MVKNVKKVRENRLSQAKIMSFAWEFFFAVPGTLNATPIQFLTYSPRETGRADTPKTYRSPGFLPLFSNGADSAFRFHSPFSRRGGRCTCLLRLRWSRNISPLPLCGGLTAAIIFILFLSRPRGHRLAVPPCAVCPIFYAKGPMRFCQKRIDKR